MLNHRYRRINSRRFIKHKQITERIDRMLRGQRASEFRDYREPEDNDDDNDDAGLPAAA